MKIHNVSQDSLHYREGIKQTYDGRARRKYGIAHHNDISVGDVIRAPSIDRTDNRMFCVDQIIDTHQYEENAKAYAGPNANKRPWPRYTTLLCTELPDAQKSELELSLPSDFFFIRGHEFCFDSKRGFLDADGKVLGL